MAPELDTLIHQFRNAQDVAVSTIVRVLKLSLPSSGLEWVVYCCEKGIQNRKELNGIPICAHGYGIELKIGDLTIDFDWGPNGEPDGFDAWRLYNFTRDNRTGVQCTHDDVSQWIENAYSNGELERIECTYFDPNRRAVAIQDRVEPSDAPKPPNGAF